MFLVSPFCNRCFHFNIQIHFALSSLPNSIHRECKFFFPYETFSNQRYSRRIYANKINGRKLSRLFDYDLKSIYVYCYRVNFLSLDIRYFHRTVKNICIYIYFNTTMARVWRKLHFRNKDLEGLLRQPRGIIRTSRVLSAEFSIDVAN